MRDIIKDVASDIKASKYLVVFTGAGISVESGIPAYRGEEGLWSKFDPNLYANITYFLQDSSYYWNFFREVRYPMLKKVKPNKAHLALAELETAGNLKTVITQNIDGLHQEAGSSSVVELHGTTRVIYCLNCSQEYSMDEAFSMLETQIPPLCSECNGKLRPAVVFFGVFLFLIRYFGCILRKIRRRLRFFIILIFNLFFPLAKEGDILGFNFGCISFITLSVLPTSSS